MTSEARGGTRQGRAVVIGGSMAGLISARVLSDHFEEVIVVERDSIPDGVTSARKGVPQGRHIHGLLKKGSDILEGLFPGMTDGLLAAGAHLFDFGKECAWYHAGGWKKSHDSGVMCISASRPLIESEVRRRLFAIPGVRRLDERDATALIASDGGARIRGVRVRARDGAEEEITADLCVEASGRGSRLPRWLEELGYKRPRETVVKVDVAYAGRVYRVPEGRPPPDRSPYPWKMLYVIEGRHIGALLAIEGGLYMSVLVGLGGDHPPTDPEGYRAFSRNLPTGEIARAFEALEPVSDIDVFKFPANVRRHYEELDRFPDGLVAVGDAVTSFNPIYGQGMTASAVAAMVLDASLRAPGRLDGLRRRHFRALARALDAPWGMTTGEDLQFPEVEGRRPFGYPAMRWYLDRVHRACTVDTATFDVFLRAMHMLDRPEKLMAPAMALRVLRASRSATLSSSASPVPA